MSVPCGGGGLERCPRATELPACQCLSQCSPALGASMAPFALELGTAVDLQALLDGSAPGLTHCGGAGGAKGGCSVSCRDPQPGTQTPGKGCLRAAADPCLCRPQWQRDWVGTDPELASSWISLASMPPAQALSKKLGRGCVPFWPCPLKSPGISWTDAGATRQTLFPLPSGHWSALRCTEGSHCWVRERAEPFRE